MNIIFMGLQVKAVLLTVVAKKLTALSCLTTLSTIFRKLSLINMFHLVSVIKSYRIEIEQLDIKY